MEHHKNDSSGELLELDEVTLCMIFKIFHENSYYRNGRFPKNNEIHIKGECVKIQELIRVIIVIYSQK